MPSSWAPALPAARISISPAAPRPQPTFTSASISLHLSPSATSTRSASASSSPGPDPSHSRRLPFLLRLRSACALKASSWPSLIWKYGTKNVEKNPWFRIGYAEWERPVWMKASFDHFWLLTAVRFGVIPSLLFAVVTAGAIILLARRSVSSNPADAMLERGIYVIGFSYPVVPKGQARIRVQISAGHSRAHLDKAIQSFVEVGQQLGVL